MWSRPALAFLALAACGDPARAQDRSGSAPSANEGANEAADDRATERATEAADDRATERVDQPANEGSTSRSIGAPNRGRLDHGVAIRSTTHMVVAPSGHPYGTAELVALIARAS